MAYGLPIDIVAEYPPGTFVDAPTRFFEAVVNSAWNIGLDNRTKVQDEVDQLIADLRNSVNTPTMTPATLSPVSVDEPFVTIPASADVDDVFDKWKTEYLELAAWMVTQFTTFRTTYFPDEQTAYNAMEDYLQAAIANPTVGMPDAVASQIWTDDRDRIVADAERASEAVIAQFAAKGFALPPGAAASAVLQIEQKAQDEIAESSRKVAVMSVEQMKWTVDNLLKLRDLSMKDAVEYIKALASGPDMTSRLTNVGYDAQSKLITSVASYYGARTQAKELLYKGQQHNADLDQTSRVENMKSELMMVDNWTKALLAEIQSLTQQCVSMFNNLHAQASQGTNVQYRNG
jgi:hypothetical protein